MLSSFFGNTLILRFKSGHILKVPGVSKIQYKYSSDGEITSYTASFTKWGQFRKGAGWLTHIKLSQIESISLV